MELPAPESPPIRHPHRPWFNRLAGWVRWLHLYASMLGLAATLFFSVTGLTLNHPDWFPLSEQVREAEGILEPAWIANQSDPDKLAIVEHLRNAYGIRAQLRDFVIDEFQYLIAFAGPGYTADIQVDPETGHYQLREVQLGLVPVINDLHKGRDTSAAWSVAIDGSAILLTFISLTGLIMILWLKRRILASSIVAIAGTTVLAILACWFA